MSLFFSRIRVLLRVRFPEDNQLALLALADVAASLKCLMKGNVLAADTAERQMVQQAVRAASTVADAAAVTARPGFVPRNNALF